MKNKFRYETFKVLDYPRNKVPSSIFNWVKPTYRDSDELLEEHMYSPQDFEEYKANEGDALTLGEDKFITEITALMAQSDSFYVRFLK